MHLLLVDNLLFEGSASEPAFDLQPHLGLMSLAAVGGRAGHQVSIYDPKRGVAEGDLPWGEGLYEALASKLISQAADAIGFTALGCNFHCVARVARHVRREAPHIPILLGGPHATILHEQIIRQLPSFDIVVRHEGEEVLPTLLDRLEAQAPLDGIPGVTWRAGHETRCNAGAPIVKDLDRLPFPEYSAYPLESLALGSIRIEAGRGCPFSCTFCSTASFFGRDYRLKSADRLIAEMDRLSRDHGYVDFKLNHDLFTVNRRKVLAFCEAVRGRGYTWSCSARMDCVDNELLKAMADAGCRNIYFGVETGSDRIQATSRKRLDLALVDPVLETTSALGIVTTTSFIIGYPDEEPADQAATLDLATALLLRHGEANDSQVHLLTPEPGTELLVRHSADMELDAYTTGFNLPLLDDADRELVRELPDLFVNHYYFPTPLPRGRNVFAAWAWRELHSLGRLVLGYLLDQCGQPLSALVVDAHLWWASRSPLDPLESSLLARYVEHKFGPRHPAVSAIRFSIALRAPLPTRHLQPLATPGDAPRPSYRLSERAVLLRDIHDVGFLLAHLEQRAPYDQAAAGERGDLLVLRSEHALEPPNIFRLSPDTADLLEEVIAGSAGAFTLSAEDAVDLCRLGVLRQAGLPAAKEGAHGG